MATPIILAQILYNEVAVFHGGKAGPAPAAQQMLAGMVTLTLLLLGPFTVPSWTNMSLTRLHYRDRGLGTYVPVLCTGIQPGLYWIGRLAATFCGAYVMLLFSVTEGMLLIQFYFKVPLAWSFSMWAGIFISSPLVSLCVPAFGYLLSWINKATGTAASFMPMIIIVGTWLFALRPSNLPLNPLLTLHVSALISAGLIAGMALAANNITKGRIVGLN